MVNHHHKTFVHVNVRIQNKNMMTQIDSFVNGTLVPFVLYAYE